MTVDGVRNVKAMVLFDEKSVILTNKLLFLSTFITVDDNFESVSQVGSTVGHFSLSKTSLLTVVLFSTL